MNAEEFWEQFRSQKIAVAIRSRSDQSAFWEAARDAGLQTSFKDYGLAAFPWAIFALSSHRVSGWAGRVGVYHPDTYMKFEDVKNILSGCEDIELCADGLESIL